MDNIIDTYYRLLGTLIIHPKLIKNVFLSPEQFFEPYDNIFKKFIQLINDHGSVTIEDCKIVNISIDDYVAMMDQCLNSSKDYFIRLQEIIADYDKEVKIKNLTKELHNKGITVDEYFVEVEKIKTSNSAEGIDELTKNDLVKTLAEGVDLLQFHQFKQLQSIAQISKNDFIIVAGAPGTGKSGFALNLMNDLRSTYPCLYFNMEMSSKGLNNRLIAMNSDVEINTLKRYRDLRHMITDDELKRIEYAISEITSKEKIYVKTAGQSINQISSFVSSSSEKKHAILFIDHIGLITSNDDNIYAQSTRIAKKLRSLALNYNFTIIALCQLNREGQKDGITPKLSHLRDSGELEQSATSVIFLYKKNRDNANDRTYCVEVAKNRDGNLGRLDVTYNKFTQKFKEITYGG